MASLISLISLLAGCLLTLAFAPFNYWYLSIASPALLLFIIQSQNTNQASNAFWRGYLYGIGFFSISVSWIYVSIHDYGNTGAILACTITAFFVAFLAIYPAVFSLLTARFAADKPLWLKMLLIPWYWIIMEWLRVHLFSGFPWVLLGTATLQSPWAGFIPIIGVYGESFLCICIATSLAEWLLYSTKKWRHCCHLLLAFGFSVLLSHKLHDITWTTPAAKSISITLIQPNIPQELKWLETHQQDIIDTNILLSKPYWHNRVIIWPEAAITVPLPYSRTLIDQLSAWAKQQRVTLITGIPIIDLQSHSVTNSIIVLGQDSLSDYTRYDKRHLVPFGEYVPFEKILRGLIQFFDLPMSNFVSGAKSQKPLRIDSLALNSALCYEIAFPELTLDNSKNTQAILTLSNDTWFGKSLGPKQHLEMAQFRAAETGKPVIRDTNNGFTTMIDQHGKIIAEAAPYKKAALSMTLTGMNGSTPLTHYGHGGIIALITIISLLGYGIWFKRRCSNVP